VHSVCGAVSREYKNNTVPERGQSLRVIRVVRVIRVIRVIRVTEGLV
jgi:hypothetical protein